MNPGIFGRPYGNAGRRVTGLVRVTGTAIQIGGIANAARAAETSVTSPAGGTGSLALLASVSGRGQLNWCGSCTTSSPAVLRTVLEVDGIVIFDQTANLGTAFEGHLVVGGGAYNLSSGDALFSFQPVMFESGFRLLLGSATSGVTLRGYVNAEIHA